MIEAGVTKGYIAVKDTYLNALITLGGMLSNGNEYTQYNLTLTESTAPEITDMNTENTLCIVYDKNCQAASTGESDTKAYIKFRQAKKEAADKAKTVRTIAYADALK